MNKTPIGMKFVDELVKVNDQLCYLALLHHEFKNTMSHFAKTLPDNFTSSMFPTNPFAERIYRKASELPLFGSQSQATGLRMAIVVGFEHVLAYLDEAQAFRREYKPSIEDNLRFDAPEEQMCRKLKGWLPAPPKLGYFTTLGYCRHMRNSFAHGHESASKEFTGFAAKHGHSLNKFWNNGFTELYGFDFKTAHSNRLSAETSFAVMNLLRICLKEIDSLLASTLTLEDIFKPIVDELFRRNPELKRFPSKIASKARTIIEIRYGERIPLSVARELTEMTLE